MTPLLAAAVPPGEDQDFPPPDPEPARARPARVNAMQHLVSKLHENMGHLPPRDWMQVMLKRQVSNASTTVPSETSSRSETALMKKARMLDLPPCIPQEMDPTAFSSSQQLPSAPPEIIVIDDNVPEPLPAREEGGRRSRSRSPVPPVSHCSELNSNTFAR